MKKLFLTFTMLSIVAFGISCNRSSETKSGQGPDDGIRMEQESGTGSSETQGVGNNSSPTDSGMQASPNPNDTIRKDE